MSESTPRPWFVHDFTDPSINSDPKPDDVTISCDHPATITVATMARGLSATLNEARANAALIVEAVNSLSAHKACVEELAAARARPALFDQMRETLKHVLADLKSPFPKEAQAIARLRMGESSIEKAEAILAALKALENKTGE